MPVGDNKTAINTNICLLCLWKSQVALGGEWLHLHDAEQQNNQSLLQKTPKKPDQQMVSDCGQERVWHEHGPHVHAGPQKKKANRVPSRQQSSQQRDSQKGNDYTERQQ